MRIAVTGGGGTLGHHIVEELRSRDHDVRSAAQREQVLALATNFPQLWNDPGTADRERKRMVRLLIEDITIRKKRADSA